MSKENVESLKQTLTSWHKRKIDPFKCFSQITHDLKLDRITINEARELFIWLNEQGWLK